MERESPIKSWMHRHSPIKGRNKPLPVPPSQIPKSPSKRPISQISGNAEKTISEPQIKSKRRLASFFKSTDKSSSATDDSSGGGLPKRDIQPSDSSVRSIASPNLRSLSAKVNSLEEQLREAREQLDKYASSSRRARHDTHWKNSNRENHATDRRGSNRNNDKNNENFQTNVRLEGIVESLLLQHQQEQQQPRSASAAVKRPLSRPASADLSEAFKHYRDALDAYEEAKDDCATLYASEGEDGLNSPEKLKRRRSQVRSSSWQAVQDYAERKAKLRPSNERPDKHNSGRASGSRHIASEDHGPVEVYKNYQDKSLPRCPPKAISPTPRKKDDMERVSHHRRSSSKPRNDLPEQEQSAYVHNQKENEKITPALSPSKRYSSSPSKLLPVAEEFEWDDEVF